MKVRITDGTAVFEGKEITSESGVVDLPEDAVESLQASTIASVEIVGDASESGVVETTVESGTEGNPGAIDTSGPNEGTVAWLRLQLDQMGVEFDRELRKDDLEELYLESLEARND